MGLVHRQPEAKTGMLRCPCSNCKNKKVIKQWDVWTHLYLSGFTRSYKIWYHHGETDYELGSTSEPQPAVRLEDRSFVGCPYLLSFVFGLEESILLTLCLCFTTVYKPPLWQVEHTTQIYEKQKMVAALRNL